MGFLQQGLPLRHEVGDRAGEAATLHNIGATYSRLGEHAHALKFLQQALPLRREVGDRQGEAVTLTSFGVAYKNLEEWDDAIINLEAALALAEQIQHTDIDVSSLRVYLEEARQKRADLFSENSNNFLT